MARTLATDPPVSEAQRRAMEAAAHGNSNIGIPEKVGAEFAKADPGGKLPETAKDMTGEEFGLLRRLINKFFGEEAIEPEHRDTGDDAPKGRPATVATADGDEHEGAATKERREGKLSEREEAAANPHVEARADKPKSIYLLPAEEKYPVKEKQGGEWKYTRNLLLAAAREARMHGRTDLARRADAIRAREFPEEEAADIAMKRVKGGMEEAGVWLSPLLRRLSNASVANVARDAAPIDWSRFRYPQPTKLAFDHATLAVGHEVVGLAFDRASVRGIDNDGRLHVDTSNLTKENISKYKGSEIPGWEKLGLDPNRIYKLYRPADELEKPETVESFNGIPVLNEHIPIDADSHAERSKYVIGSTGTHAKFQRPYMKNALAFWPKGSIDNIENERTKELSAGYAYTPDMTPGMFNGEPYDGRMTKIRAQHMALIPEGRVGHDVAVADEKPRAFSFSQV